MAKSKYGNRRVKLDGYTFDSEAEARRYRELCLLQRTNPREIVDLEVHPRFKLWANGELICTYVADFSYSELNPEGGVRRIVVEDVKGVATPEFKIKAKLFESWYRFPVTVIPVKSLRK